MCIWLHRTNSCVQCTFSFIFSITWCLHMNPQKNLKVVYSAGGQMKDKLTMYTHVFQKTIL